MLPAFLDDLRWWVDQDRRIARQILALVESIRRDPFDGIGKPEPLTGLGTGMWSRRITIEHRLVYEVVGRIVRLNQARKHY